MLCRRIKKINTQSSSHHSLQYRCSLISRSKCSWINSVFTALKTDPMSSHRFRHFLRDLSVSRWWNIWFRTHLVSSVVKRCRRERGVRDMLTCFRHTFLRPSRTFLLSATAAYKSNYDGKPGPCSVDVSDEDLQALIQDIDEVDELSRKTLFCQGCSKRLIFDKKQPGVMYCSCPETHSPGASEDGWVPFMEAEDVIIWRKEYKPGGLFAYKVYGRYRDLMALDFATIQLDGAYRVSWDDAVAALAVVERPANGIGAQAVMHWEVLWPRFFSNRDYVYVRRHKEFAVKTRCLKHKEAIFEADGDEPCGEERESVHSNAKRKGRAGERRDARRRRGGEALDKVYVIVSRSCTHPAAPETSSAVRVREYWSNMVIRTIDGPHNKGMEFCLTYYDEPSVGGMPSGVSAWATSRQAPMFLAKMRRAAARYGDWRRDHPAELSEFEPFGLQDGKVTDENVPEPETKVEPTTDRETKTEPKAEVVEEDAAEMERPETPAAGRGRRDRGTQTDPQPQHLYSDGGSEGVVSGVKAEVKEGVSRVEPAAAQGEQKAEHDKGEPCKVDKQEVQKGEPEGEAQKSSWWRYLYPFYYFV